MSVLLLYIAYYITLYYITYYDYIILDYFATISLQTTDLCLCLLTTGSFLGFQSELEMLKKNTNHSNIGGRIRRQVEEEELFNVEVTLLCNVEVTFICN